MEYRFFLCDAHRVNFENGDIVDVIVADNGVAVTCLVPRGCF